MSLKEFHIKPVCCRMSSSTWYHPVVINQKRGGYYTIVRDTKRPYLKRMNKRRGIEYVYNKNNYLMLHIHIQRGSERSTKGLRDTKVEINI